MQPSTVTSLDPPNPVLTSLTRLHRDLASLREGELATYIPELARANPDWFGICLATTTGSVYEVGDTAVPFTIQSISKPFVYGLALEDHGRASVLEKVGVEPTGDAFNSISLEPGSGRPRNPMINAGAIATTGLVCGKRPETRFRRILEVFGHYAGHGLALDDVVYRSERETGHRNRAIGHLLRNFGILTEDPDPVVDVYFRQCSVAVTCRDLALMAATLANRGVHPATGRTALRGEYVESVLSVMETCGMYDFAGRWLYEVGLPAKSGVSGGLLAVLPGQLGIGVFSPRLDPQGNSVRGIRVCRDLSRFLDLHVLNEPPMGRLAIRRCITGAEFSSTCVRNSSDVAWLRAEGHRLRLYQLQGHLTFPTTETVVREVLPHLPEIDHVLLDFRRVLSINESACGMIAELLGLLASRKVCAALAHVEHLPGLGRFLRRTRREALESVCRFFQDNDHALEWAENRLLASRPSRPLSASRPVEGPAAGDSVRDLRAQVSPPDTMHPFELLRDISPSTRDRLLGRCVERRFEKGEVLVEAGSSANEMYLLGEGTVNVLLGAPDTHPRRVASFSAGMHFGEMAVLDRAPRSAWIVAETPGRCWVLTAEAFESLQREHPADMAALLRNLCRGLSARLRKANEARIALD